MITSISPIRRSAGWGNFLEKVPVVKKHLFKPPFTPLKRHGKFFNYNNEQLHESPEWFLPSIRMFFSSLKKRFLRAKNPNLDAWIEPYQEYAHSHEPLITWLGHATMLIQLGNINILADPIFESPSLLFPRVLPLGIDPQKLPPIDVVVISHNHRDHMDEPTIHFLHKNHNPLFLVPEGNKSWFLSRNIKKVEELTWWETYEYKGVDISCVPVWHWSQRTLFDHNKTLWCGWVFQTQDDTVFFGGDTAYCELYFKTIGKMFPNIGVALMPVGPCDPDHMMRRSHMSAEQAGQAFLDCGARYFIPMHWGTFHFGTDMFETPIERLTLWWQDHQTELPQNSLCLSKLGQQFHLAHHKNLYSNTHDQNR